MQCSQHCLQVSSGTIRDTWQVDLTLLIANKWFVGPAPRRLLRNEGVTVPRNRLKLITESDFFYQANVKTEFDFKKTAHSLNLLRIAFLFVFPRSLVPKLQLGNAHSGSSASRVHCAFGDALSCAVKHMLLRPIDFMQFLFQPFFECLRVYSGDRYPTTSRIVRSKPPA